MQFLCPSLVQKCCPFSNHLWMSFCNQRQCNSLCCCRSSGCCCRCICCYCCCCCRCWHCSWSYCHVSSGRVERYFSRMCAWAGWLAHSFYVYNFCNEACMHSLLLLSTCCPPTTEQNSTAYTESSSDGNGLGCDHLGNTDKKYVQNNTILENILRRLLRNSSRFIKQNRCLIVSRNQ